MTRSAGLLLHRERDGFVEVLLGHSGGPFYARRDDGAWTLPKGEHDDAEEPLAAAYREFAEEIGRPPPGGDPVPLGETRLSGGKRVAVWALAGDLDVTGASCTTFELEWPRGSGRVQQFPELDRVGWFDLDTARRKVFASQRVFLDRLAELLRRPH